MEKKIKRWEEEERELKREAKKKIRKEIRKKEIPRRRKKQLFQILVYFLKQDLLSYACLTYGWFYLFMYFTYLCTVLLTYMLLLTYTLNLYMVYLLMYFTYLCMTSLSYALNLLM